MSNKKMSMTSNKPLKIMQLVLTLNIGGTEKLVHDIVRKARPHKISSVVCCLDQAGEFGENLEKSGWPVYVLNRRPGVDWNVVKQLTAIIRKEKINVIHAHHYTPYFYGAMALLAFRLKNSANPPKIVFTEHGIHYPYRRKFKRMLINPFLCRLADELITIAEYTKKNLIKYENFPRRRLKVIYNGIDTDAFDQPIDIKAKKQSLGLGPDAKIIGMVARLDPVKNYDMLLKAFRQVQDEFSDVYLLIAGNGPEESRLKNLAQSLNINEKTLFLGARQDVSELLHIFDIFALTSFSEGMSLTLLEAMAAGRPIVTTNVGGNPEVVQNKVNGCLVASDDDADMATKFKRLLQDETLCLNMGQKGYKKVNTLFSINKMLDIYTKIYFDVCRKC